MGKTSLTVNIVEPAVLGVQMPAPTLLFSLEMHPDQLVERLLAALGRIDYRYIRTGSLIEQEWPRLTGAAAGYPVRRENPPSAARTG